MKLRDVVAAIVFLIVALSLNPGIAIANPYLAKPGEPTVRVRIGACAVTGGFIHLYSALDNRLFEKYGINAESIVVRGGGVALAALASDEINFSTATPMRISCALAREQMENCSLHRLSVYPTWCWQERTSSAPWISKARVLA
jgi:ABC-type nitrate/sulfonate/bicarbonate transport system substrate-binding protein